MHVNMHKMQNTSYVKGTFQRLARHVLHFQLYQQENHIENDFCVFCCERKSLVIVPKDRYYWTTRTNDQHKV